ncbi:alkaline phosphatase D family protein [Hydrogenophaga sp. PAMC20947]|uniref:alkaline phosphatase D family protein n=1 Tax=Hydrogenophaga sp. PAMC20947 TaxID=2565558 RepID=UPI001445CF97|nr:alkaline phosphatase D family protein [Hydrogenophaga sp. PAMC20947]
MAMLGPILQFLGNQHDTWGVSLLLIAAPGEPKPTVQCSPPAQATAPTDSPVPGLPGSTAWRVDIAVPQSSAAIAIDYQCNGQAHRFQVPPKGSAPSLGYVSCNGFSDLRVKKSLKEPQALWLRLARLHQQIDRVDSTTYGPLHLLLMGGDQIYSDDMWTALPELLDWTELPWTQRIRAPFTATLQAALQTHYAQLYIDHWGLPEQAAMLASVPAVMMWDDHDIIDGWGSHPTDLHESPVFQGIYAAASAAFELFQRQMIHGTRPPATLPAQDHHNSGYRFGTTGLLVLDMRSERSPRHGDTSATGGQLFAEQVMSETSWRAVYRWLDEQASETGDMKHLYVMSSIPVVHPSFELLEKMLGVFPGQQELEDDLRDHWTSPPHKAERLRLIHRLLKASETGTRVTILSGDVHVAAVGVIESDRSDAKDNARIVNQLTSSGVVHPPPLGVALFFLEQACKQVETIDRGITGAMYEFPTTSHRMIGCRNMMTIQPDAPGKGDRIWVNWWAEGEPHPYTKVIHPVT